MNLYPAIDLMDGQVVRLTRGEAKTRVVYNDDPVAQARSFEAAGATHLHVVDLDAAFGRGDNRRVVEAIVRTTTLRVQVGGGVRNLEALDRLIGIGVWRVVVGSAAVENPHLIERAVAGYRDRVAVGLDARDGVLRIKGWTEAAELTAIDGARRMAGLGVETLIYTDIARDGMLDAPDIAGAVSLAEASGCQVVVSGGVSGLADLEDMARHPARSRLDGVIVGKAIYEGRVDVGRALSILGPHDS